MNKRLLRILTSLVLIAALLLSVTGCSGDTPAASTTTSSSTSSSSTSASTSTSTSSSSTSTSTTPAEGVADAFTYPMENVTLTINMDSDPYDASEIEEGLLDQWFWPLYQEKTGVTLEAVGGASGAYDMTESFLLLLASGDYPDLIQGNWISFTGGPNAAINDGYIIPLNDYTDYFPSLMQVYEDNPDWYRMVQTDDGVLYNFPYLRGDVNSHTEAGMVIRQDWLDAQNLPIPTTIDELTETMRTFKSAYNLSSAFTFEMRWLWREWTSSGLSSAYGVCFPFFVDNGVVKFGMAEDGYREFMAQMAAWYEEGLLDPDFPSINKATVQSKFASGDVGISIQQLNNVVGCVEANLDNPDYQVSGVPSFVDPDTGIAMFSHYYQIYDGSFGISLSSQCDQIEDACRFLDYLYSDEGRVFATFGTEGETFEYVNGEPVYTDYVMNNPDGYTPGTVKNRISRNFNYAAIREAFINHIREEGREAHAKWVNPNMDGYVYPPTTFTSIESSIISRNYSNIETYCQESMAKFVTGQWNTDTDWDAFIEQLNGYGLENVLKCYQDAYDRYMAR